MPMPPKARHIIIAGAGIAGLTAAIAFARHGFAVQVLERATTLAEVGAGLQLSPNATCILAELEALDGILPAAVRPDLLSLRDARTLAEKGRVELGAFAEARWGAPYLVLHRADLQSALLARLQREMDVEVLLGAAVRDVALHRRGVTVSIDRGGRVIDLHGRLLVGADGVWSTIRRATGRPGDVFSGYVAWRTTLRAGNRLLGEIRAEADGPRVTSYMAPGFHMVSYPIRAGAAFNLVVIARGQAMPQGWDGGFDTARLAKAMVGSPLSALAGEAGPWTTWPLHTISPDARWTEPDGLALIGDAAHAMTPFAAQGAAMAIEDAATLAAVVAASDDLPAALAQWERNRRIRVDRVLRRGRLNRLAWHAAGPTALARNTMLRLRSAKSLAKDFDWLYGWTPPAAPDQCRIWLRNSFVRSC